MLPSLAHKYLVAALQAGFVVLTALLAVLQKGTVTGVDVWQLIGVGVGAVLAVWLPLVGTKQAALLKIVGVLVGALITAGAIFFAPGGWNATNIIIVILAVLNALFTQIGVAVRVDGVAKALADPNTDNDVVRGLDPAATKAAYAQAA
jgi:hypothetical protein